MSWVFLAGNLVYKLKKPVSYRYFDFTTLESRRLNCLAELKLNGRLAEGVYLDVVPLRAALDGTLTFNSGDGVVEWLVRMRRLPAERMLDALIQDGGVEHRDVQKAAQKLAGFYVTCTPQDVGVDWALARFSAEHEEDRTLLSDSRFNLEQDRTAAALFMMRRAIGKVAPLLEVRCTERAFVEGHGDLRPEHICLLPQPVFIDCLEFNRELRLLDPFDEIAYLGLECERLGAAWVGEVFLSSARESLLTSAPEPLLCFYRAARALLRARLALAHLTEPQPRTPEKWEPRARQYIRIAEASLERLSTLLGGGSE
ncbi:hypothetical protein [Aestuariivirga sp.]|uniref:hypothetical protein n=1 Tax=Aestuariivirga sp. TaxID=2650926 RepID=UPI00391B0401